MPLGPILLGALALALIGGVAGLYAKGGEQPVSRIEKPLPLPGGRGA